MRSRIVRIGPHELVGKQQGARPRGRVAGLRQQQLRLNEVSGVFGIEWRAYVRTIERDGSVSESLRGYVSQRKHVPVFGAPRIGRDRR